MMIQEIAPHTLDNAYHSYVPQDEDLVLAFDKDGLLVSRQTGRPYTYAEVKDQPFTKEDSFVYVFAVDGRHCFLAPRVPEEFIAQSQSINVRSYGKTQPELQLACSTAMHLRTWYNTHRFCGVCGKPMHPDTKERAMKCEACGHLAFPVICPAIIVAITDGDRILLTRSAVRRNAIFSLVAGFTEIGETLEQTAAREAMEEVGLKIKNIRPYVDQPWGFSSSLMVGFFADLDGDDTVHIQEEELKEAKWFTRDTMPVNDSPIDITHHMMEMFRQGKV
ncbi:MAG: NAD(+) diphosphatase [Eubacteriales bacterium]|nr:NAD(+) diphosphatase [Eubacteriales bacterium]